MERKFISRNLPFGPVQFGAVTHGPNWSSNAGGRQQCTDPPASVVQGLRDDLYSANHKINSLQEDNKSLKEKIGLLEDENRQKVNRLREELKQKDELLQRAINKRRARTKAHVDTLALLTQKEKALERSEEQRKSTCKVLEEITLILFKNSQFQKKAQKEQEKKKQREEKRERQRNEENEQIEKQKKEKMECGDNERLEETQRSDEEKERTKKEKAAKNNRWRRRRRQKNMLAPAECPSS